VRVSGFSRVSPAREVSWAYAVRVVAGLPVSAFTSMCASRAPTMTVARILCPAAELREARAGNRLREG